MAVSVPPSRFTPRVGGGSAFGVRQHDTLYEFITTHPEGETEFESYFLVGIYSDIDGEHCWRIYFGGWSFAARCHIYDASLGVWPVFIAGWPGESFRLCVHFHSGSEISSRS